MGFLRVSIVVCVLVTSMVTAKSVCAQIAPVISQNPTDVTLNAGQTATFVAAATGSPTPTVQWEYSTDGGATYGDLGGMTTTTLSVPSVVGAQNGMMFRAVFANGSGSATTTAAVMTVNFRVDVTMNPTNQTVAAGGPVSFVAAAIGNPAPTVRWQQSSDGGGHFAFIPGATSPTLTFTTNFGENGNFYKAIFSNPFGAVATTAATLTTTPLGLLVDDGYTFARYGATIDYVVKLDNFGAGTIADVDISSTPSPGLLSTSAHFTCVLAVGAVCPPNGTGALAVSAASLPAGGSLTWIVRVPISSAVAQDSVTMSVNATASASASDSDTDTLVLLRDGFESTGDAARIGEWRDAIYDAGE